MKIPLALSIVILGGALSASSAKDVPSLIGNLRKVAAQSSDTSGDTPYLRVKDDLLAAGAEAIPYLLPLLRDKDKSIRDLSAWTLEDIKGLTEKDFDALAEAYQNGHPGLGVTLAKINSAKATPVIIAKLVRTRQWDSYERQAFETLGEKAVPGLIKVCESTEQWDEGLQPALSLAFKALRPKADAALEPFLAIIHDPKAPLNKRASVLCILPSIGPAAERAIPDLVKLRSDPNWEIHYSAIAAMLEMQTAASVPILLEFLEKRNEPVYDPATILRSLAELGAHGRSAIPALKKYLDGHDWELRVLVTRALGYIGDQTTADDLLKMLDCEEDWRVQLSAAEALGRLRVAKAVAPLQQAAKNHWYPPVRAAASASLKVIQEGAPVPLPQGRPENEEPDNFGLDFFAYEQAGLGFEVLNNNNKDLDPDRFDNDATPFPFVTVLMKTRIKGRDGPTANAKLPGIKVAGGSIVGTDSGEWGGALSFVDQKGEWTTLVDKNTKAVFQGPKDIYAVTGLAHGSMNEGMVYKIHKDANGKWQASPWRVLAGEPFYAILLKDGRLVISTYGAVVLISPDGSMKQLAIGASL